MTIALRCLIAVAAGGLIGAVGGAILGYRAGQRS